MKTVENKGFLTTPNAMGRSVVAKPPVAVQKANKINCFVHISYGTALNILQIGMTVIFACFFTMPSFGRDQQFIIGADISWVDQDEAVGARYFDHGVQKDIFQILKDHKFNWIRLRTFVDPTAPGGYSKAGYCDLAHTLKMAKRVYAAGMNLSLDFHYSDIWADPGHYIVPTAWKGQDIAQKSQSLYDYTKNVLTRLKNQGTLPQMVQVGNEINNGMAGETSWDNMAALLRAGIKAVREVDPTALVVLHIAKGGDYAGSCKWIDNAQSRGVVFDVLGESCYTEWQGQPAGWKTNFTDLAVKYPKLKFIVAEYSPKKREANDIAFGIVNERGLGTFIWEPTRYQEAAFTRSGNNYYALDLLLDLYPAMSKDYGNGALPLNPINSQSDNR